MTRSFLLAIAAMLSSTVVHARVFDFNTEGFSSYFGGTYGASLAGGSVFDGADGTGVTVDQTSPTNAGGEIGFAYRIGVLNFKVGGEVIKPKEIAGAKGSNAANTELYTLASKTMAVMPTVGIETFFKSSQVSRGVVGGSYGWGTVTVDNSYVFTAAGTAAYGLSDYDESATGTMQLLTAYVGYERLFTDTVTMLSTAGYRIGKVTSFKSTRAAASITGNQSIGTEWVNSDGTKRTVDLGGFFLGLSFRFYL